LSRLKKLSEREDELLQKLKVASSEQDKVEIKRDLAESKRDLAKTERDFAKTKRDLAETERDLAQKETANIRLVEAQEEFEEAKARLKKAEQYLEEREEEFRQLSCSSTTQQSKSLVHFISFRISFRISSSFLLLNMFLVIFQSFRFHPNSEQRNR